MSKVYRFDNSTEALARSKHNASKPVILLVTTDRWYPTERLARALKDAGCTGDAVCPPGHPFGMTQAVRSMYDYNGLAPIGSVSRAIRTTNPDIVIPADDLATWHLHGLYSRERGAGDNRNQNCKLIE